MISIVNGKSGIYCGRGTPYGNPLHLNKDESKRDEVCDLYENYFYEEIKKPEFKTHIDKLIDIARDGDLVLSCHCKPKRCHVETIKRYIENELTKELISEF